MAEGGQTSCTASASADRTGAGDAGKDECEGLPTAVIVLGMAGSGKSSLMQVLMSNNIFPKIKKTRLNSNSEKLAIYLIIDLILTFDFESLIQIQL